ncbi:hypothetical protein MASR1M36_17450 [Candidatus Cloacimonadaceae bacterium]
MTKLTDKEKELVRIGTAIGSNCIACIEYHIPQARKAGLNDDQIRLAINIAKGVKKVPGELVLEAALNVLKKCDNELKKVLVLCTGNSCRSIMAEALINHLLGERYLAYSAGVTESVVNPFAIKILEEIGIETSGLRSKNVSEFLLRDDLDLVITVCDHAKESCPVFLKPVPKVHIGITDPAPYSDRVDAMAFFRKTKDEILAKVIDYLKDL